MPSWLASKVGQTRASSAVPRSTLTYFPALLSHCPNGQEQPHSYGRGIRRGALSEEEEDDDEEEEEESYLVVHGVS